MSSVTLHNVSKSFRNFAKRPSLLSFLLKIGAQSERESFKEEVESREWVLNNINLHIDQGETLAIVGPSGCGKTTLLKIIAGLEEADSGSISFNNTDVSDFKSGDRKVGMVFQNFALYPHLTSKENMLTYFLFKKQTEELDKHKEELFQKTSDILGVDIAHLLDRKPPTLSGGEKQRVAIGRCITREPNIFLLDEPFSNLDAKIRESYRIKLKNLLNQLHTTTLFVTHDQHEAMLIGDKIAVMSLGKIEQTGTFDEVYNTPASMFVADFLSLSEGLPPINFIPAEAISLEDKGYTAGIRSEDTYVTHEKNDRSTLKGKVTSATHLPAVRESLILVDSPHGEIAGRIELNLNITVGEEVRIEFGRSHIFDPATGIRLRTIERELTHQALK